MIYKILHLLRSKSKQKRVPTKSYKPRAVKIQLKGKHFDLKELYDQINAKYFESKLELGITWVGNKDSMPRTRVMFGSYTHGRKLIKIHRRLDQPHIPHYFISFIVYHEMLHHVLPPVKENRKYRIHHGAFTQKEKEFEEYSLAKSYSKEMKATWFKRA